jgi:uncharacterized protein (TIGR01319 family)
MGQVMNDCCTDELIVVVDVGSTFSKQTLFRLAEGGLELLARSQSLTTVSDVGRGLAEGQQLLDPMGQYNLMAAKLLASSSAAGGLKMAAIGNMPQVTAKAAKEAAMNAGARVLEVLSCDEPSTSRVEALKEIKPDLILLAGGTDGGEEESLVENATLIVKAGLKAMVIVAGNRFAQSAAAKILTEGGTPFIRVANVMPTIHELRVEPARAAIHSEFVKRITRAPGLSALTELVDGGSIMPTPSAVLAGAELLAKGLPGRKGVGALMVVDLGGATTDVHSVIPDLGELRPEERGLVLTDDKQVSYRTVEGNLGLRVSAGGILETVGATSLVSKKAIYESLRDSTLLSSKTPIDEELKKTTAYVERLENNHGYLPQDEWEAGLEWALAAVAVETAIRRHAGRWITERDPVMGLNPGSQSGRDLRGVKTVVGVGGFFVRHDPKMALEVLKEAMRVPGLSLMPEHPELRLDADYILYAVGLLRNYRPAEALELARKSLKL